MAPMPKAPAPAGRFIAIWVFSVRRRHLDDFKSAYGPAGTWAALFRKADGYLGTELCADRANPRRFFTIDRWRTRAAFDAFHRRFRAEYEALDRLCEPFTEHEQLIAELETVG